MASRSLSVFCALLTCLAVGCSKARTDADNQPLQENPQGNPAPAVGNGPDHLMLVSRQPQPTSLTPGQQLARWAESQIGVTTVYDAGYARLPYPGGDLPIDRGACTDVVVRALRNMGVDLQVLIHEDMKSNFKAYPHNWGLRRPDSNIDHRRVANIACYLRRAGKSVPVTTSGTDYLPGDIVVWCMPDGSLHMGIVSTLTVPGTDRHMVVHNYDCGALAEDLLFAYEVTDHFRYFAEEEALAMR